jgi:hypothetical protein
MSNTLVTGQFINSRIYFHPFDDKTENLYIAESATKDVNETGMKTHWMLTGVFYWALGLAWLVHYNERKDGKDVANFVFVNKASCESWIKKFSTASWNEGFADKKFANHEATIKYICDKAISKISQDNADKKAMDDIYNANKKAVDDAHKKAVDDAHKKAVDDVIKQAKDHFKGNKDEREIVQLIEKCLNLCHCKGNHFIQNESSAGDIEWEEGTHYSGVKGQAHAFMVNKLGIAIRCHPFRRHPYVLSDQETMDNIYNSAIEQAKDHFKGNKDEGEIIQLIENCLNLYNYKENEFRQKMSWGGNAKWVEGIRDGGPKDQAYQFMEKFLGIVMTRPL